MGHLDLEHRWPHLFAGLTPQQRTAVVQTFVANAHEGQPVIEEEVALLVDYISGDLTAEQYDACADQLIVRRAAERAIT